MATANHKDVYGAILHGIKQKHFSQQKITAVATLTFEIYGSERTDSCKEAQISMHFPGMNWKSSKLNQTQAGILKAQDCLQNTWILPAHLVITMLP